MGGTPEIGAAIVGPTGIQAVDGLLTGVRWNSDFITYSDPDSEADYQPGYFGGVAADGFRRLDASQLAVAHAAFSAVARFTNLTVDYAAPGSGEATIRLANISTPTAYAYYPSGGIEGGDTFFGASGQSPILGDNSYFTILHEIGHTLGLKHAHETHVYGAIPIDRDSVEYSVMTYRGYVGDDIYGYGNERFGYPQTFMMFDIAALQHMYGADYTTNAGRTTYSWNPSTGESLVNGEVSLAPGGNRIFSTIWDGGGVDTYDASNYGGGVRIDLRPGEHSTLSVEQLAHLGGFGPDGGFARANIFNALMVGRDARSVIERAIGGDGADTLTGNGADNRLTGNRGADVLCGARGEDRFDFNFAVDSVGSTADRIVQGHHRVAFDGVGSADGDRVDLAGIDANVRVSGNQGFELGGKGIAHVRATDSGTDTIIRANTDRDKAAEFRLIVEDGAIDALDYSAGDFLL